MTPVLLSWSGGKDCCMALHALQRDGACRVAGLFTTVTQEDDRIAMHGVARALVERQAAALGLPIDIVPLPRGASNAVYEERIGDALARHRAAGVRTVAYGDLFLEDIRRYREALMERLGSDPVFPVWGRDTAAAVRDFVAAGFRAVVVSVDLARLPASFAGRAIDEAFLADLPPDVDPCGENGEYHSFVLDGPGFAAPIDLALGAERRANGMAYRTLVGRG